VVVQAIKNSTVSSRIKSSLLVVAVLWLAAFRLLEISWFGSTVTTLSLGLLGVFGCELAKRLVGVQFGIAVGVVIGFGVLVFAGQVLRISGLNRHLSYWLPLGAMALLLILFSKRPAIHMNSRSFGLGQETMFILALGLVAMSLAHPWLAPFALAVSASDWLSRRNKANRWLLGVVSCGVVLSWYTSQQLRPEKWWYFYQSNDAQFFESLSWSTARWTIFDHPGLAGGSITNYHWFTYTAFGVLSSLAELGPWDALMKVGMLVLPALFASLFVRASAGLPEPFSIRWIAVVLGMVAMEAIRTDSLVFSMIVGFAFLIVVLETTALPVTRGATALFVLLSAVLVLSKVSTAAVLGLVLVLFAVFSARRAEPVAWVPVVVLFVVSFVAYLVFFRGNDTQQVVDLKLSFNNSTNELSDLLESRLLINALIVSLIPFVVLAKRRLRDLGASRLAVAVVAILGLIVHLVLAGKNTRYLALPGIWLVMWFAVHRLDAEFASRSVHLKIMWRRLGAACLVVGLMAGYVMPKILLRLDSRFNGGNRVMEFVWGVVMSSGALIGLLLLVFVLYRVARHRVTAAFLLMMVLGVFAGQSTVQFTKLRNWGPGAYETDNPGTAIFGNKNLEAVGRYVRKHTKESTILASNHFCCFGASWQTYGYSLTEFRYISVGPTPTWSSKGGGNFLLPVYTERRFLAQGLGHQGHSGQKSLEGDPFRRFRVSLEFANRPSQKALNNLKNYNVMGFIVNLSLTDVRDWSEFAIERFRAGEFVYLELK